MAQVPAFLNGENPSYGEADENGFVGVSPEYANFANDTDAPLEAAEGEEAPASEEREDNSNDESDKSDSDAL